MLDTTYTLYCSLREGHGSPAKLVLVVPLHRSTVVLVLVLTSTEYILVKRAQPA
jgi:hypothetical protein